MTQPSFRKSVAIFLSILLPGSPLVTALSAQSPGTGTPPAPLSGVKGSPAPSAPAPPGSAKQPLRPLTPVQGLPPAAPGLPGASGVQPTSPEQAEAPQAIPKPDAKSPIELSLGTPVPQEVSRDLKQFGYDLFQAPASTFAPVTDVPVGSEYVLGPGDTLQAYMWGMVDDVLTLAVNQKGEVFLPRVGTLPIWGITFGQAEDLIRSQLSRYFSGFRLSLAMSQLRAIKIFVVGEVVRPGSYTLSSLATVTNALFAAGGPTKLGSLRTIQLLRNNHTVGTLDFYDFLLRGDKTRDFRLESGDTIFVPPIGPVAAIGGSVKRPAIYEMKGPMKVSGVIAMAGGVVPTGYLERVQIERVEAHSRKVITDVNLAAFYVGNDGAADVELKDGDFIKIFSIDSRIYNRVTLEGFIQHPGDYELKPAMRLSDLLRPEELLPEAFLERVEVVRVKPDLNREILGVNIRQLWQGDQSQDLDLRSLDQIVVGSEFRKPAAVTLAGEVKRPGTYAIVKGERLSSVVKRAGGFTEKAYLKGAIFTRESVKQIEKEKLEEFARIQEQRLMAEAGAVVVSGLEKEEVAVQQQTLAQRREFLKALASRVTLGRVVIKLDELEKFEDSPSDIPLEDGDTLTVSSSPSSVLVLGSVRNSTAVLHREGETIEYYLERAGGVSREADEKEIHIMRADGSATASFLKFRTVEPGDTIVVPPKEEVKIRPISLTRDILTIIGQFALTITSLVALAALL